MPNLTEQLYNDFESMYKITKIVDPSIFFNTNFITTLMLNLYAISYNSAAKTLYIIRLYFIKN